MCMHMRRSRENSWQVSLCISKQLTTREKWQKSIPQWQLTRLLFKGSFLIREHLNSYLVFKTDYINLCYIFIISRTKIVQRQNADIPRSFLSVSESFGLNFVVLSILCVILLYFHSSISVDRSQFWHWLFNLNMPIDERLKTLSIRSKSFPTFRSIVACQSLKFIVNYIILLLNDIDQTIVIESSWT